MAERKEEVMSHTVTAHHGYGTRISVKRGQSLQRFGLSDPVRLGCVSAPSPRQEPFRIGTTAPFWISEELDMKSETEIASNHSPEDDARIPPDSVISGFEDPAGEAPWAMQFVVEVQKASPPSECDVLVAAARATAQLLCHPEAQPGGEWHEDIQRWLDGRIRKLVRRARGAAWEAAASVPSGVSVTHGSATVRAFVPCPVDQVPAPLAKLQVAGLDLQRSAAVPPPADGWPGLRIATNPVAVMSTGKMAAQVAHSANIAVLEMPPQRLALWAASDFAVWVQRCDDEQWEAFIATAPVVVTDAGFTELAPGTQTTAASWDAL